MENIHRVKLETQYFTLFELKEGVFAAIEKENNTGSNAGIIDLGDITVIFDTFLNIDAAKELKKASEELTGRAASFVINSHGHTDHFIGNCLFSESTAIISTKPVRDTIAEGKVEFAAEKSQYVTRVKEIEALMNSGEKIDHVQDLNNELLFLRNLIKKDVEIRVPNVTVEKELIIHGSKRSLHLIAFDAAHSSGDMIAYLPFDNICFMGDLLFNHSHPWLGSGNPEKFIDVLEDILRYEIKDFVPGHGAVSTKVDVLSEIQYIYEMIHLLNTKKSINPEDYSIADLSPMFRDWKSLCFTWNVNFLIERLKNKNSEEQTA